MIAESIGRSRSLLASNGRLATRIGSVVNRAVAKYWKLRGWASGQVLRIVFNNPANQKLKKNGFWPGDSSHEPVVVS